MRSRYAICCGASALVLASLAAGAASAQTAVDELIVTAQKREQLLQDVPAVVTVATQEALENAGVKDIKDLQILTPGLMVTSTSNESVTTARIRGVGTVGDNPGLESSVSVVIDGVYRPRNGVGFGDLGEIERIEILKGPQGTLFGKNTSAGVINVVTQEPSFTSSVEAELTAGNYGLMRGSLSATGPIIEDKLAGRLFVSRTTRDGFIDVVRGAQRASSEDVNQDYYTGRGQLLWLPTDNFDVKFIGDYSKRDELCCLGVHVVTSGTAGAVNFVAGAGGGVATPPDPFARIAYANRDTRSLIEDKGLSMETNWQTPWFDGARLTSITAYRDWSTDNGQESDFSRADLVYRPFGTFGRDFSQFSEELRMNGQYGRVNWLVGGFYADEKLHSDESFRNGTQLESYFTTLIKSANPAASLSTFTGLPAGTNFPAGSGYQDAFDQSSTSWALFTNNSIDVTDALEVTIGLRYTSEEKTLATLYHNTLPSTACQALLNREATNAAILGGGNAAAGRASQPYQIMYGFICSPGGTPAFDNVPTSQSRDESKLTGTLKVAYRFNDSLMTYASYARGYKAGGFNLDRARSGSFQTGFAVNPDTSFGEEMADSYELGFKSTINDNLLFNATAFSQKYTGFQLNTFTGISFIVASIPEVNSEGVDVDLIWSTPIEGLGIQGGVTYADTKYGQFTPSPGVSALLPGNRLSFAPLWSASLSGTYERPIGNGVVFKSSLSGRYSSEYNTGSDLNPLKMQGDLFLLNGRVGIAADDDQWALELWGQNITDEDYYQVMFDATYQPGGVNAFLGAPATYGLTLRAKL